MRFQALVLENSQQAGDIFGFDVRGAGLLPVRISIDNRSGGAVRIIPRQTFLVDAESQAWPLLTSAQALARLGRAGIQTQTPVHAPAVGGLEDLTGFALDLLAGMAFSLHPDVSPGVLASRNLVEKIQHNPAVPPRQVASGVLFFPGWEEARGVRSLRLCYAQGDRLKFLALPLKSSSP